MRPPDHAGNFETPDGGYGAAFFLEDCTAVNVVTVFTGPGLAADTEIEANRPLTDEEQTAVMDADAMLDHAKDPKTAYRPMPTQHRF